MEFFEALTGKISTFMWGNWMVILLLAVGVLYTIRTRFIQIRRLPEALRMLLRGALRRDKAGEKAAGDITPFQALTTALAATVGNGNIAGVAAAIAVGGPGAAMWMWLAGIFGMATKYAEGVLGVQYREVEADGTMAGGPMYYLKKGLGSGRIGSFISSLYAVCGLIGTLFGFGLMMQSNSIALAFKSQLNVPNWVSGTVITFLAALVIIGGIKRIGKVAERLVPAMIIIYVGSIVAILLLNIRVLPAAVMLMIKSAFSPMAALGGFAGASIRQAISTGVRRGVLSNEAGLGSASIAHGAAKTSSAVRQGMVAMSGVFVDTIIVCFATALVLIVTRQWNSGLTSTALTAEAFNATIPFGGMIVALASTLFGFTTLIGYSYYGEQCLEYLVGIKFTPIYRYIYVALIFTGAVLKLQIVWNIGDIGIASMALPNLIGMLGLSGIVASLTKEASLETQH
jgi:AGCS family alanine or glycine:cation symporter